MIQKRIIMKEETFLTEDEWNNSDLFTSKGGFSRLQYINRKDIHIFLHKM